MEQILNGATLPARSAHPWLVNQPEQLLPGEEKLVSQMLITKLRTEEIFSTERASGSTLAHPMGRLSRNVLDSLVASLLSSVV